MIQHRACEDIHRVAPGRVAPLWVAAGLVLTLFGAILRVTNVEASPWTRIERHLEGDQVSAARTLADSFAAAVSDPVMRAARFDSLGLVFAAKPSDAALQHATSLFETSLALRERSLGPDHLDVATSLEHLATLYFDRAEYEAALPLDERSLAIRRKQLGESHPLVAATQRGLGTSYVATGRYTAARPMMEAALATFERDPAANGQDLMELLTSLGELRRIENRYADAESCQVRALRLARAILPPGDDFTAYPLNNLAGVYKDQGRFDAAEPLLRESLTRREAAPVPDPESLANAQLNLAELYRLQGRVQDADSLYAQALRQARIAMQSDNPQLVWFLNQQAVQHREQKRWKEAEANTREALAILEKSPAAEALLAQTLCDLAELMRARGRPADAEAHDRRAIAIRERLLGAKHPEVALARIGLARGLMMRADARDRAGKELDGAIRVLDGANAFPEGRAEAYATRAKWHSARRENRAARADLAVAIATVEELRPRRGAEDVRTGFLGSHAELYDDMVRWCIADSDLAPAFEYAERSRARAFLEQLAAGNVEVEVDVPAAVRAPLEARTAAARLRLMEYQDRINVLLGQTDSKAAHRRRSIAELERERDQTALELRRAQDELRRASPRWRSVTASLGQQEMLDTIQRTVIASAGILLEYQIGAEQSFVLVLSQTTPHLASRPLVVDAEAAIALGIEAGPLGARDLVAAFESTSPRWFASRAERTRGIGKVKQVAGLDRGLESRLHALWRILVPGEVWSRAVAAQEVVVVPDGALHGLPFEALVVEFRPDGASRDWLEAGPVVRYAPSATALAHLEQRTGAVAARRDTKVLSVANPEFDGSTAIAGRAFEALPGTASEAKAVEAAFARGMVTTLRGRAATEARVRTALPAKRFVHLATHGLVDRERNALVAGLAFAAGAGKSRLEDDGFLQLFEIYDLQLDCDLAVLSACETGAGIYVEGEGVSTLSRAFLAAGAARVIASLWAVEDASTAALVGALFKRVVASERTGQRPDIARALRDAKRDVRARPEWSAPFYWAPFVLTGAH